MRRGTDAPGFYAAFPWGGYAQSKGATGTRSDAILAHALYIPLSLPRIFYAWLVYSATVATDREAEGLHWSVPARGAVLCLVPFPLKAEPGGGTPNEGSRGLASSTKGPFRRKTCTPKTAMTPVVATIRLRRSSPCFAWASLPI